MHGGVEVLAGLDVTADHPPLVRRPRGVLVAVLEQDVTARVDEEDDGDPGHARPP